MLERLQKVLARAGIASRRGAEKMILEGRVTVNGKTVDRLGFKVDPEKDHIKVDGKLISRFEPKVTILLNKPKNYLSTVVDPRGRPTVMDLLKNIKCRVYPVGRLDFDAEGLLLLTNDGELAYRISHPKFSVPRIYVAKVSGVPDEKKLERLHRGIALEDGRAKASSAALVRRSEKNSWIRIEVTEGRNHLVKRMLRAIGHPVLKLKRIGLGPLRLGNLPPGGFRILTQDEVDQLKNQAS